MIINHKYKFIFVHIHKTAGSSIRNSLLKLDGSEFLAHHHTHLKWIDYKKYEDYYKFCFVRNPWDRLVSWYFGILKLKSNNNLQKYIKSCSNNFSEFLNCRGIIKETIYNKKIESFNTKIPYFKSISYNQLDYVSDDSGNILVNFIGRFENLNNDWNTILSNLSINKIKLFFENKGYHKNYKEYYQKDDINKVYEMYKKDIDYFGYEYE